MIGDTGGRIPYVDELLSREPRDTLFHYTSAAGLLSITESMSLLAGRPQDQNDRTEQQLLRKAVASHGGTIIESMNGSIDQVVTQLWSHAQHVFTVSLSAHGDQLSQWRAYCPRSGGFAIGLKPEYLRKVAAEQAFYLGPCLYEVGDHRLLAAQIVEHHDREYIATSSTSARTQPELLQEAVRNLAIDIARYGPLLKHASFSEEEEWRLVSQWSPPPFKFKFIAGTAGIKMYLPFQLRPAGKAYLLQPQDFGVRIGPNVDMQGQELALDKLLEIRLGPGVAWHGCTETAYQ